MLRDGRVEAVTRYSARILDLTLDELQPLLPAVVVNGAKGVGKTATASRRARSVVSFDRRADRELFDADPQMLNHLPGPVLVDEWQRRPDSWDIVRRAVDEGAAKGRFLLAGSAGLLDDVPVHSGAGRMVSFQMRPMSIAERHPGTATVSLRDLLAGGATVAGSTDLRLADYTQMIVESGYPDIRQEPGRVRTARLDGYLDAVVQREFAEQGHRVRRPQVLRNWLTAYAAATATTASYSTITEAATPGLANKPAKDSVRVYRDVLTSLWLLDPVAAWLPSRNRIARLGQAPKHYLADPALAASLLGVDAAGLLRGHEGKTGLQLREGQLLGRLFEHLVVMSVHTYAEAAGAVVRHLRTSSGAREVDMVLERRDGTVVAMEVKLSASVDSDDVTHLHWLKEQVGDDMVDAVVITTGQHAYRRKDSVAVVPAALLGP